MWQLRWKLESLGEPRLSILVSTFIFFSVTIYSIFWNLIRVDNSIFDGMKFIIDISKDVIDELHSNILSIKLYEDTKLFNFNRV